MSERTRHVWEFVETLTGPIVYLAFFGLTYFVSAMACALSRSPHQILTDAPAAIKASVLGLALIALVLISMTAIKARRMRANAGEDREDGFMGLVALVLALLSAAAVVWTALPVATLTAAC